MTLLSNLPYEYTSTTQLLGRSRNSGHFNAVNAISVSKDGQFLATGDNDGLLIVSLAQSTERPLLMRFLVNFLLDPPVFDDHKEYMACCKAIQGRLKHSVLGVAPTQGWRSRHRISERGREYVAIKFLPSKLFSLWVT